MGFNEIADEETIEMCGQTYHVHAIISNIEGEWSNQRVVASSKATPDAELILAVPTQSRIWGYS